MADKELVKASADVDLIMGDVLPQVEDRKATSEAIVAEILQAPDVQGLFRERSTIATKDLIGVPLAILDLRLQESTLDDQKGVWMLIRAIRLETGEQIAVNTGARNIMAMLWRAKQLGELPVEVTVVKVGRARPGESSPLSLAPYGKTATLLAAPAKT